MEYSCAEGRFGLLVRPSYIFKLVCLLGLAGCGVQGGVTTILGTRSSTSPPSFSLSPTSGPIGTLVSLSGADFSLVSSVSVNGTQALILQSSSTAAVAMVMPGSTTGAVSAVIAGSSLVGSSGFSVISSGTPNTQQGSRLTGTGGISPAQGIAVSLSADGNTLAVGGQSDNSNVGASWIFTRSGTSWSQQGSKLIGTGGVGSGLQGTAVSLSADGNTLAVGGWMDDSNQGATWIFTRSGTTWTQQGSKLVGTGAVGAARQGTSVSLSADGNVLAASGAGDDSNAGAVWIYTRSGTTWTQQGSKLIGSGAVGAASQGGRVSLSSDGNTLAFGGSADNANAGATWIFTRSGSVWTQQGSKLVGTGAVGVARQGSALALNANGNILAVGGWSDDSNAGATWIFTRSGTTWTQEGSKLVGSGAIGAARQGTAVSLNADGSTLATGAWWDNSTEGAAWIFARSGGVWTQQGSKLFGSGASVAAWQGRALSLSSDGNTLSVGGGGDNSTWIFVP